MPREPLVPLRDNVDAPGPIYDAKTSMLHFVDIEQNKVVLYAVIDISRLTRIFRSIIWTCDRWSSHSTSLRRPSLL